MTELGLEPTCHETFSSRLPNWSCYLSACIPQYLLFYPNLSYTVNTQQVLRDGDIVDWCCCPADKRNVNSPGRTADLLKMWGLERVDDSVETEPHHSSLYCWGLSSLPQASTLTLLGANALHCSLLKINYLLSSFTQIPNQHQMLHIYQTDTQGESYLDRYTSTQLASHLWQPPGDSSSTPCGSAQHTEQPGLVGDAPAYIRGVWTRWSLKSLPTQAILWFCDSYANPDRSGDEINPKQLLCLPYL